MSSSIQDLANNGVQQPAQWAEMFFTSTDHIARFVALPAQSLKRPERLTKPKVQTRLVEVHALLRRVRPWFSSDQAVWAWFIGEPLLSFGRLTPSEVVRQYGDAGLESINDWVTEREMGGFQ